MNGTLSTRDLPATMLAPPRETEVRNATPVLTCAHGPACPACILASARALLAEDSSLSMTVYTA